ncbi:MAG: hypothetical protein ACM3S1_16735 [Hyphomicrobiales bacterium]
MTVDGVALKEVEGSTRFAKTEALDVNANDSSLIFAGDIRADSTVEISVDSTGRVLKGDWDLPLQ